MGSAATSGRFWVSGGGVPASAAAWVVSWDDVLAKTGAVVPVSRWPLGRTSLARSLCVTVAPAWVAVSPGVASRPPIVARVEPPTDGAFNAACVRLVWPPEGCGADVVHTLRFSALTLLVEDGAASGALTVLLAPNAKARDEVRALVGALDAAGQRGIEAKVATVLARASRGFATEAATAAGDDACTVQLLTGYAGRCGAAPRVARLLARYALGWCGEEDDD